MKKIVPAMLLLCAAQGLTAQNLLSKIPSTANAVISVNADRLNQLMPMDTWHKTALGKKLNALRDSSAQNNCISDYGLNPASTLYYFHVENDSISYHSVLVSLSDAAKLDKSLAHKEIIRLPGNVRKIIDADSSGFFLWNEQQLAYAKAALKEAYFKNETVARNHGLTYGATARDYDENEVVVVPYGDSVANDEEMMETDTTIVVLDTTFAYEPEEMILDTAEVTYEDANENDFEYYSNLKIKRNITAACVSSFVNELFYNTPEASIATNQSFLAGRNPTQVANIWVDKPMAMYYKLIPGYLTYKSLGGFRQALPQSDFGYESFSASIALDEKQLNIHSAMQMSPEMAAIQEKIFDRKINKRFYKYINTDSMLGYMSWSLNTKAYLQQFPAMIERTYGSMGMGIGADEYALAMEFFSFLIDEEAIANMVKGDALVLFDGVFKQETTYTDYTYNENFEQSEVQKTKMETLPRFLMMLSSEENNLVKKIVSYGMKHGVVKEADGFYEIEIPKSPMRFYFAYKNDVFFLTNSIKNISDISSGKFKANISKQEKKMIGDHAFSMYLSPKNISDRIAGTDLGATESLSEMLNTFRKMGPVRMKMNPIKNNISSADTWIEVPDGNTNALTFFFDLFEGLAK